MTPQEPLSEDAGHKRSHSLDDPPTDVVASLTGARRETKRQRELPSASLTAALPKLQASAALTQELLSDMSKVGGAGLHAGILKVRIGRLSSVGSGGSMINAVSGPATTNGTQRSHPVWLLPPILATTVFVGHRSSAPRRSHAVG